MCYGGAKVFFFFLSTYLVQWTFRLNCEFQSAL